MLALEIKIPEDIVYHAFIGNMKPIETFLALTDKDYKTSVYGIDTRIKINNFIAYAVIIKNRPLPTPLPGCEWMPGKKFAVNLRIFNKLSTWNKIIKIGKPSNTNNSI